MEWHKKYNDYSIPVLQIAKYYNVTPDVLTTQFKRLGLPVRPKGFIRGNANGRHGHDPNTVRLLWFFHHAYKRRAKRKNLEVTLTNEQFVTLVTSNCNYCGKSWKDETRVVNGNKVNMLSVDRINSKLGYTFNNCVSCCKICNTIKMDLQIDQWLQHLNKIIGHMSLKIGHL